MQNIYASTSRLSARARRVALAAILAAFASVLLLSLPATARAGESECYGYPASFEFLQDPSDTLAAAAIQPDVTVLVLDDCGDPVQGLDVAVDFWDATNPGATLGGTTTQPTNADGVATFDDLEVDLPGLYTLQAHEDFSSDRRVLEFPFGVSEEFSINLQLAVGQLDGDDFGDIADVEKGDAFPVTVRTVDADGNPIALPEGMSIGVTLAPFTCLGGPCGHSLGGDTTEEIAGGESEVTFSVSYPVPQNFLVLQATATGGSEDPFTVDPGHGNAFNVFDELIPFSGTASTCTNATAANPVCVSATTGGGSPSANLIEASCADGTAAACLGAIAGLVGDELTTWKLTIELDKTISGHRGVPSFVFTYSLELGGPQITIQKCKKKGKPNAGQKICLDHAHRNGAGDTQFDFIGVGDPFLKGK
jgi:hypothetical protein